MAIRNPSYSPRSSPLINIACSIAACFAVTISSSNHETKGTVMIVTTTQSIEGYKITGYYGIVFGEVITGINILRILVQAFAILLVDAAKDTKMSYCLLALKHCRNSNSVLPKWVLMLLLVLIWTTKYSDKATCLWLPHQAPQLP